jgi:hypothetical protein
VIQEIEIEAQRVLCHAMRFEATTATQIRCFKRYELDHICVASITVLSDLKIVPLA